MRGVRHIRGGTAARYERGLSRVRALRSLQHGAKPSVARGNHPDRKERVKRRNRAVDEVCGRQRLSRDAAGLLQLERDLARRGDFHAAPDDVHPAHICEGERNLRHGPLEWVMRKIAGEGRG